MMNTVADKRKMQITLCWLRNSRKSFQTTQGKISIHIELTRFEKVLDSQNSVAGTVQLYKTLAASPPRRYKPFCRISIPSPSTKTKKTAISSSTITQEL